MVLKEKDFVEIEFVAKLKDGGIFDTNIKEELNKLNPKAEAKPFIFCLGEGMFLKGVDKFLIGKEIGEYEIEIKPEEAFGKRDSKLVYMMPLKTFHEKQINPFPGATFNFDNKIGKVLTVTGGRVMVDFNNPLSGKDVLYKVKVLRKIEDIKEKINAINDFFFRQKLDFKVENKKIIIKAEKGMKNFLELFKDKYKSMLELDLMIEEKNEKPKDS